jgi:RNA ligase
MSAVKTREWLDWGAVEKQVEQGYICRQKHPTEDLFVYNYTAKAQYDWLWTEETKACRGLIVDSEHNVIQRPFPKFFSADQTPRSDLIWSKPFTVTAKLDGSLGILYPTENGPAIATRGSFESEQAQRATQILRTKYPQVTALFGLTALFEIIYPDNRIVCDYGEVEDLYLLTVIENETGRDVLDTPQECASLIDWPGPVVEQYEAACKPREVLDALGLPVDGSVEGVVLRFDYPKGQHTRMKVKTDEYKRLHKLITGINSKNIWEQLSLGGGLDEILDRVPDEYYEWVRKIETELRESYRAIEAKCLADFRDKGDRKANAMYYQTCSYPPVLFRMLDQKDYSEIIWKMIKPRAAKPFRCGEV